MSVLERIAALDKLLGRLIFANRAQLSGLRTHRHVFLPSAGKEEDVAVWLVFSLLPAAEVAAAWLERRCARSWVCYETILEFIRRARLSVLPVPPSEVRGLDPRVLEEMELIKTARLDPATDILLIRQYGTEENRCIACCSAVCEERPPDSAMRGDTVMVLQSDLGPVRKEFLCSTRHGDRVAAATMRALGILDAPGGGQDPETMKAAARHLRSLPRVCSVCQGPTRKKCGACRRVRYCGVSCQEQGWEAHQHLCLFLKHRALALVCDANGSKYL